MPDDTKMASRVDHGTLRSLQVTDPEDSSIATDSARIPLGPEQFWDSIPTGPRLYQWLSSRLFFAWSLADNSPDHRHGIAELEAGDEADPGTEEEDEDEWSDAE